MSSHSVAFAYGGEDFNPDGPPYFDYGEDEISLPESYSSTGFSDFSSPSSPPTSYRHAVTSHSRSSTRSVGSRRSSSGVSHETSLTVPSRYSSGNSRPYLPAAIQPQLVASDPELFCEFRDINGCRTAFNLDQSNEWIEHIVRDHLKGNCPVVSSCWYCGDFPFDSRNSGRTPREIFVQRLEHIREHINFDRRGWQGKRPDFLLLDHLVDNQLIPGRIYDRLCSRRNEGPAGMNLRIDPIPEGIFANKNNQVLYDLRAESHKIRKQKRNGDRKWQS